MSQPTGNTPPSRSWFFLSKAVDVLNVGAWYVANPQNLPGDCYAVYSELIKEKAILPSPPSAATPVLSSALPVAINPSTLAPETHDLSLLPAVDPASSATAAVPSSALPVVMNLAPEASGSSLLPAVDPALPAPPVQAAPGPSTELSVVPNSAPSPPEAERPYREYWRGNPLESSLIRAAQLSGAHKAKNVGYRWLWGALRLPYTLKSKITHKISQSVQSTITEAVVKEGVSRLIPQEPQTDLKNLLDCLHELSAKVYAKIDISPELRGQTAEAIDDFLADQKKYLDEAPDPQTGFRTTLFGDEEKQFRVLSACLKENKSLHDEGPFIKTVYDMIETRWGYQKQFYIQKAARSLIGKAPPSAPPVPAGTKKHAKIEKSRFFETLYPPLTKPVESKKPIVGICEEIEKFKSLGFKLLLAFFILPKNTFHKSDKNNGSLLAGLIKKSEDAIEVKDSNQIFQDLIFTELDNADLNFIQRTGRKFCCWLVARPLLFFLNHVIERGKIEILYVIGLSTAERIKYINKILIEPGYEFINMLEASYTSIAEQAKKGELKTDVERGISTAIAQIKVKNLTPKELITKLVSSLIDRYLPSVNWAHTSSEHFDKRAKSAKPISKIWFYGVSLLSRGIDFAAAPWRWGVKKILHMILKKGASSAIHSFLQDSSESPLDFGKLALHSIYKTLLNKLEVKNRTTPAPKIDSAKTSPAIRQTVFVGKDIQNNISQLVSSFLKILYLQGSDVIDLMHKISPGNNVEQAKRAAMGLAFVPLVQKATEQITEELQLFLEQESFSAVIFEVLADLKKQCLNINSSHTSQGQIPLEQAFYIELQGAVKSGIREAIDEKLDPSKRFQFEADLFVEGLKTDIFDFQAKFNAEPTLADSYIHDLEQTRKELLFSIFDRRFERADDRTKSSARLHIHAYTERFLDLRKPISEGINDLTALAAERKIAQNTTAMLEKLAASLSKAVFPYNNLPVTLQKIRNNTYPALIQDSLTKLQGAFASFTSDKLKKDNENYLTGIVVTLKELLKESIEQYEKEGEDLSLEIQKKYEKIQEKVNALAGWAGKDLKCFTCKAEVEQLDAFKELLSQYGGSIQGGLSPLILKQLDAFFLFLGKNHNIKGLLWYVLKACLEISISPEEFEKVVGPVKAKLDEKKTPPAA